jgi:hypothetical protein
MKKLKLFLALPAALFLAGCENRFSALNPLAVPPPPPGATNPVLYRVQCGPAVAAFTDAEGNVWLPKQNLTATAATNDWGFDTSGGAVYGNGGTTPVPTSGFPGDTSEGISQLLSTQNTGNPIKWSFELPAGSSHIVTIYAMEDYWGPAGSRVFSVSLGGVVVEPALDLAGTVGKQVIFHKSWSAIVPSNGLLSVDLVHVSGIDGNNTIGAIKIQ